MLYSRPLPPYLKEFVKFSAAIIPRDIISNNALNLVNTLSSQTSKPFRESRDLSITIIPYSFFNCTATLKYWQHADPRVSRLMLFLQ